MLDELYENAQAVADHRASSHFQTYLAARRAQRLHAASAQRGLNRHPRRRRPQRFAEDIAALNEAIPADFWRHLREAGLVDPARHCRCDNPVDLLCFVGRAIGTPRRTD